jgi:hypothetical protein
MSEIEDKTTSFIAALEDYVDGKIFEHKERHHGHEEWIHYPMFTTITELRAKLVDLLQTMDREMRSRTDPRLFGPP